MKPIEVFYHFYIPPDIRAAGWAWWIDEQLGLLKKSKLADIAKINMAITMPVYMSGLYGLNFLRNKSPEQYVYYDEQGRIQVHNPVGPELNFDQKVREYINKRYPFVNVVNVRDTADTNIYEGQTLDILYKSCVEKDIDVLYFYNKGITRAGAAVANWKEVLHYYLVEKWPECVLLLQDADVVGVKDLVCMDFTVSGNFWWSKSSHVRTLPNPLNSDQYMGTTFEMYPNAPAYRYAFERWLLINKPKVAHIVDTKSDHYTNYCFIEDLENGKETS
jgi:hypothetical protein